MSKILLMRESKTPKAIVGYTRVSTAAQAEDGVSLDAQHARIEAYAVAAGLPLSAIYSDRGISGAKASTRPELQRAISEACKRRGVLVVYSLSRLARSTRDAIEIADRLDRAGADLVSLTESIDTTSAAGRMIFRLLAVLAEFEADLTRERTRTALRHLRGQGRRVSGLIPYGSDLAADGSIVPNAQEQAGLAAGEPPRVAGQVGERPPVLAVLNSTEFVDAAPAEVYASLLARGEYVCSPATMYRICLLYTSPSPRD